MKSERQSERISDRLRQTRRTRREFLRWLEGAAVTGAVVAVASACGNKSAAHTRAAVPTLNKPAPYCLPISAEDDYQRGRYIRVADCVSISGVTASARYNSYDGDMRMFVEPDPEFRHVLAPSNNGLLVVEVTALDEPKVYIPQEGEHATFYGLMALDRAQHHWVVIRPCWLITTPEVQGPLEPRHTLDVQVETPAPLPVGEQLHLPIRVETEIDGTRLPVSQAHLFLELVSSDGVIKDWAAGSTNTLGIVTLSLASLVRAGEYTLRVFATKGSDVGSAEVPFRILRR